MKEYNHRWANIGIINIEAIKHAESKGFRAFMPNDALRDRQLFAMTGDIPEPDPRTPAVYRVADKRGTPVIVGHYPRWVSGLLMLMSRYLQLRGFKTYKIVAGKITRTPTGLQIAVRTIVGNQGPLDMVRLLIRQRNDFMW